MDELFRLSGAARRDPAVDAWLDSRQPELGAIARRWFERFRACGEDVRELMHDGAATACVSDAAFGYVAVFTAHVNVGFFGGAYLPDPAGLLEGRGRRMRHVKLRPGAEFDTEGLEALIEAAYAHLAIALESALDESPDVPQP
jgi:hypothetical protein